MKRFFLFPDHKETLVELDASKYDEKLIDLLAQVFSKYSVDYDVRKIYVSGSSANLIISSNTSDLGSLTKIINELRLIDSELSINIVDFGNMPNV